MITLAFFVTAIVFFLVVEAVGFGAVENTLGAVDFVLLTVEAVVFGAVENALPVVESVLLTVEAVVLSTEDGVVTAVVADVMNSGSSSKKG